MFRLLCLNNVTKTDIYSERAENPFLSLPARLQDCLNLDLRINQAKARCQSSDTSKRIQNMLPPYCGTTKSFQNMLPPHCGTTKRIQNMLPPHSGTTKRIQNMLPPHSGTAKRIQNKLPPHCGTLFHHQQQGET